MKEQIKEALDKASTQQEWDTDGRTITWKDGHPLRGTHRTIAITHAPVSEVFNNENHENDAHLIANAPTWLRWQNERIEQLEDAVESLFQLIQRGDLTSFDLKEADNILKALQDIK